METYATITPNWQFHIPVSIRDVIKTQGKVRITKKKNSVVLHPVKNNLLSLAGTFKVKNPIPADKIRDYIDYSW